LRLLFSQRIQRPALSFLNPFVEQSDPRNISYGNPALEPALSNSFELSYSAFSKFTFINAAIAYRFIDNAILPFTSLGADSIARTTFANVGKNRNYDFNISGNINFKHKLSLTPSATVSYQRYYRPGQDGEVSRRGMRYNLSATTSYRTRHWRLSGSISYTSSNIHIQGSSSGNLWNNVSLCRSFLKNRMSVTISMRNPFQNNRINSNRWDDPTFHQFYYSSSFSQRYTMALTYRFGKIAG
jgi:hypothetical protein